MAAIKNAVGQFLREWRGGDSAQAQALCNSLLGRLEEATERVVEMGASLVRDGATVLTASYSSAVVRALACAHGQGRRIVLLAAEPSGAPISYAGLVREALAPWGLPVHAVGEDTIAGAVGAAELVLVGADKLLPDGSLLNGGPTLAVARVAHRRIPLYSLCESFKLDADPATEPGFDVVPSELVTAFVTEQGVLSPTQVRELF
jgi:translation initiation factor 2B subunit (eIF-2B alpha/beta/delta family)